MKKIDTFTQIVQPARNKLVNTLLYVYVTLGSIILVRVLIEGFERGNQKIYYPLIVCCSVSLLALLLHRQPCQAVSRQIRGRFLKRVHQSWNSSTRRLLQ